jgi:predicted AlkP superfamily phosphohydrolase/phosphomutase
MRYCYCLILVVALCGCSRDGSVDPVLSGRTIVLGFDGMDPQLVADWMAAGELPNFSLLAERGHFGRLATTIPAQSPVAWSSFATGLNPGGHGIYDFLRRDPDTYLPDFSVSETIFADSTLEVFGWRIPLEDAVIRNRRVGTPFWSKLEDQGGSSTVIRVPVTFPPDDIDHMISGMGVPDLLGTQGTYTLYSTRPLASGNSARVVYMKAQADGVIETTLSGPPHPLTIAAEPLEIPMQFSPTDKGVRVVLNDSDFRLNTGDWSDWVDVSFDLFGVIKIRGLVKLYLIDAYPRPKIYVSPMQIDPRNPVVPLSSPTSYVRELSERIGLFHTIGMPEETWSLNNGHLPDEAFLAMVKTTFAEREAMLFDAMENNQSNLIASVFVQTDRVSHMFYRGLDPESPLYEETNTQGRDAIAWSYREADRILGKVLQKMREDDRLIVISDHGFSPYRWSVHLNKWLLDNGYLTLSEGSSDSGIGFANVDWSKTRAYALGLNSLYLNIRGRESEGIVEESEVAELKQEITQRLQMFRDEQQQSVVKIVYDSEKIYQGNANQDAPDLVVGYQRGYRVSWQTTLGAVPNQLIEANYNKWSGDHCIAADEVPGVLFTSFKLQQSIDSIQQVADFVLEDWRSVSTTQ